MTAYVSGTALLALLLLAGCSEEKSAGKPPRPVRTVTVQLEDRGEVIVQTGEIRSRHETAMSFRLDGHVISRVENGTMIKAGDVVARIDPTSSRNNVLNAKANLASANADFSLARLTVERSRDLFAKNITSQAKLQEAEASLETASARVEAAQAALANAEETLAYTDLKAGRDGIISAVGANEGQVVSAGQMVVTLISDVERDAVFDVPEKLMHAKPEDLSVAITLISDPLIKTAGRIREVTPSADPATRTYRVKVGLSDAGRRMPFGAAVTGSLALPAKKLVSIPASALTENNGKPAVFVLDDAGGAIRYRDIRVERYTGATVLVADGLRAGDVVATSGISKLREGEIVTREEGPK